MNGIYGMANSSSENASLRGHVTERTVAFRQLLRNVLRTKYCDSEQNVVTVSISKEGHFITEASNRSVNSYLNILEKLKAG